MKKHFPNTLTCCNLISGCIATFMAFQGLFDVAFMFIIIGAVFDFLGLQQDYCTYHLILARNLTR